MARRAVVVEADPDIVELLEHYLSADGWAVDALADGRRALDRARSGGYQLVILDLQLPGIDGLTLCAELRREAATRDLPVVMLTARGDEADRIRGPGMGAGGHGGKPLSPKEVGARRGGRFPRPRRQP